MMEYKIIIHFIEKEMDIINWPVLKHGSRSLFYLWNWERSKIFNLKEIDKLLNLYNIKW